MAFIEVNRELCMRDGICVADCPLDLLGQDEEGYPGAAQEVEQFCLACGHCISVCPKGALKLSGSDPQNLTPIRKELVIGREQAEQFLKSRRSIRIYKDKPVPREILADVIDGARWAPTAKNGQPVHWIVVEKSEDVHRFAGMTAQFMREKNILPEMLKSWELGKDMILRGAPHLLIAHAPVQGFHPEIDCAIAITYAELMANACGLGTCWAGMFMTAAALYAPLAQELALPQGHNVYGALMIGYPKYKYKRIPQRKPAAVTWR